MSACETTSDRCEPAPVRRIRAGARDHLGDAERFDDVVVRADLEAEDPVGLLAAPPNAREGAPNGTRVLQFYPAADGSSVLCLWETTSVDAVQRYADDVLGDASANRSFEVNAEQAFSERPLGIRESATIGT